MPLKIAVCIKSVPEPGQYDRIKICPDTKSLVRTGVESAISGGDRHALALAFAIKEKLGGAVTALTMGPPDAKGQLLEALAMGADRAVLLSDGQLAGSDALATSYALHLLLKNAGNFDLVLTGNESDDGGTTLVPSQLGEWMGLPHMMDVAGLEIENDKYLIAHKEAECEILSYKIELPCLLAVKRKINTVPQTTVWGLYEARSKTLETFGVDNLNGLDKSYIGLTGSPTKAGALRSARGNRNAQAIEGGVKEIAKAILNRINKLSPTAPKMR